jgi:diguanylate cyclase
MRHSQRGRRLAVIGLALVLLALTTVSIAGAASTRRSAELVTRSTALAAAYQQAHEAVTAEESLERKYRLEPGPDVRARHRQAADTLIAALAGVEAQGNAADHDLVQQLRVLHRGYLAAIDRMFTAVDAGDTTTVLRIDNDDVDPAFDRISDLVETATLAHARAASRAVQELHRTEGLVFASTVAGFAVGLALVVAFAVLAVSYQRRLLREAAINEYQAWHDSLTGLPNRTLFTARTVAALQAARTDDGTVRPTAVMLLDLDRFKEVNDTLGHHYGDELLRQVAARTQEALRPDDTVARLSGDEFAVLLPDATAEEAMAVANRLQETLHSSFVINDVDVDIEVSIGVAITPDGSGTARAASGTTGADAAGATVERSSAAAEAALRCADIAMYAAKDTKTGAELYRPAMHIDEGGRLLLLGDLRRALAADDELSLHYQPKVSLDTGELRGVEALLRWRHPTRGSVPPAEFVPVAETTGLINRLTLVVLRMAIAQGRTWLDEGLAVPIAVNLSPRCLLESHLVADVRDLLTEFGMPANLLRLEVTETAVMSNPAVAMVTLRELHELGVALSIDDYGTGYSSMAYLKQLPVDELKVDRTFVMHMHADRDDAVLVRGAIELGHNLGMTVVAEGVEEAAHVSALQAFGCDIAQGYHYARPMPAADLAAWIHTHQLTATKP